MASNKRIYTGVTLEPETVEFLAELSSETQRNRSWLINAIVLEQARILRKEREAKRAGSAQMEKPAIRM